MPEPADIRAVVFDLYGTLYDVHSVAARCDAYYPARGIELSAMWRQKQLEYTWLRSLMRQYIDFEQATADALVYSCRRLGLALSGAQQSELCDAYLHLTPFAEVPAALHRLNALGVTLAILSNGSPHSIDAVVRHSGLVAEFAHLISVEPVQVFKPDPRVYELACRTLSLSASQILFVSSNSWDATGAGYFGFATCWVDRGSTFEEMGRRPDHVVRSIDGVVGLLGPSRAAIGLD